MDENEVAFGGRPMTEEEKRQYDLENQPPPPPQQDTQQPVDRIATDNVANFIEENLYVPLVDTVDNLLGDNRSTEQIRSDRKDLNTKVEQQQAETAAGVEEAIYSGPIGTVVSETTRAVLGGREESLEKLLETGLYLKDYAVSPYNVWKGNEKNIPWSDSYKSADVELGIIKENKTAIGNTARGLLGFAYSLRALKNMGVRSPNEALKGIHGIKARLGAEFVRGMIIDFFDFPGEANLSNIVQDGLRDSEGNLVTAWENIPHTNWKLPFLSGKSIIGGLPNPISAALMHQDEDKDLTRRFKNTVEGGPIGMAVDGFQELVPGLLHGLKKGIEYQAKTGKAGGDVAVNEAFNYLYHGTHTGAGELINEQGFRFSDLSTGIMGEGVYFTSELGYANTFAEGWNRPDIIPGILPDDAKILDLTNTGDNISVDEFLKSIGLKPSEYDEEFGVSLLPDETKLQLKRWAVDNGYAGIKYFQEFRSVDPVGPFEYVFYDDGVANEIVGSPIGRQEPTSEELDPTTIRERMRQRAILREGSAPNKRIDEEIYEWERWKIENPESAIKLGYDIHRGRLSINAQLNEFGLNASEAVKYVELENGTIVPWRFLRMEDPNLFDVTLDKSGIKGDVWNTTDELGPPMLEIIWDRPVHPDGKEFAKLDQYNKTMFSEFPRMIEREVAPGTVLVGSPEPDLNSSRYSEAQLRRAGILKPGQKLVSPEESLRNAINAFTEDYDSIQKKYKNVPPLLYRIIDRQRTLDPASVQAFLNWVDQEGAKWWTTNYEKGRFGYTKADLTVVPPDNAFTMEGNTRARIYQKMFGFGDLTPLMSQFAVVRRTPKANGQILDPINVKYGADGEIINQKEILLAVREALWSEIPDPTKRPGYSKRKAQQDTNPRPEEEGSLEASERAGRTTEYSQNEVAVSQDQKKFDQILVGGSNPGFADRSFEELSGMSRDELVGYIKMRSPEISIDKITKALGKQPAEYINESLYALARFATDGNVDHIRDIGVGWRDVNRFDADGVIVLRNLVNDASEQMYEIADYLVQLDELNADIRTQAIAFIHRTKALMKLKKEASSNDAFGLMGWWVKKLPPNMYTSINRATAQIDEAFSKYLDAFESGDEVKMLEVKDDFLQFAKGTLASQGDPVRLGSFFSAVMRVGIRNANQAVINAWLSSPVSQARNIAGNALVAIERPLATAIGHSMVGEWREARAGLAMFDSLHVTTLEAIRMAKRSAMSEGPITEGNKLAEYIEYSSQTKRELENAIKIASNPGEKFVANMFNWHYDLINLWFNRWPGRGLQSGDDMFKAVIAQQDLRYDAAIQTDAEADRLLVELTAGSNIDLQRATPDEIIRSLPKENADFIAQLPRYLRQRLVRSATREGIYQRLLEEKIGPNGEILDPIMLHNAQEATFQLELQGKMKRVANSLNAHPELKQFIPFIKTPHNLNVFAFEHIPFIARKIPEWEHTMKYGTPQQKALHRGREAIGYLLVISGALMFAAGRITGNGPLGKNAREIWRQNNEPMSIQIGEDDNGQPIWMSYRGIPGAELLFSAIADTGLVVQNLAPGERDKFWAQLGFTIMSAITNRTTLMGFIELGGLLDFTSWTQRGSMKAAGDRLDALFPFTGGMGQRNAIDLALSEGIYEYRSTLDAVVGRMSYGLLGSKVPVIDIFTGKQMVRGTEGWHNFLNPYRVVHKNAHPVAKRLAEIRFEFNSSVVDQDQGIPLTIEEQQFVRKEMYSNGDLARSLETKLNSTAWKNKYKDWEGDIGTFEQVNRSQSEWYSEISQIVSRYRKKAMRALRTGNDPIAIQFQTRLKKSKTEDKLPSAIDNLIAPLQ